ncbi:MAG: DUF3531 family protein [Spirulinaceae cyanobacterium]
MEVQFREFNPFDLWIWLEFETVPANREKQFVEEVFNSWFFLGKLGGYNAESLQVQDTGIDLSYLEYNNEAAENSLMSPMHNMGEFDYLGLWGRCWFDLGTSDLISLDILLNALRQFNKEYVQISRVIIGGENEDWPVEGKSESLFYE